MDTDILIDHLRGRSDAREFLQTCGENHDRLLISVITLSEIMAGVREGERQKTRALLNAFEHVPVMPGIAKKGGEYRNHFGSSHGVRLPDALIAATAAVREARLYTHNVRHYPMDDVTVVDPYER